MLYLFVCKLGMFPLNIPLADLKSGENKIELVLLDGEGGTVTSTITITLGPAG